jgi:NagD protein
MMRIALKKIGVQREQTIIIGDRMDTDIVAGIEAEIDTCLVLTGISDENTIHEFAYRPHYILNGVNEIVKDYKYK